MASDAAPDLSGTPYRLLERAAHGEFGAWYAEDGRGERFVVKPRFIEAAVEATDVLRPLGYPVPRYVFVRPGLSVQAELPGAPLPGWTPLDPAVAARAIELNELQAGKRVSHAARWPDRIYSDIMSRDDYVDPELVRRHSAELLERCRRLVRGAELAVGGDLVHWDFTTANILATGNEITGVVDWEGVCNGDRLFDLVTLFYYTRTDALREYVLAHTDARVYAAYLSAMIVRQTAYSLKFHDPEVGPKLIDDGLELSETFPA